MTALFVVNMVFALLFSFLAGARLSHFRWIGWIDLTVAALNAVAVAIYAVAIK